MNPITKYPTITPLHDHYTEHNHRKGGRCMLKTSISSHSYSFSINESTRIYI